MLYTLDTHRPVIDENSFIADSADIIGQVEILSGASIWFNTVLRGDNDLIRIGRNSNIQDGSVVHTDPGLEVLVDDNVTVGHRVVLHGCHINSNCLIGINSVILDGAQIGSWCLIGANSMITSNKIIPAYSLVLGSPGKVVRELNETECKRIELAADGYRMKINRYRSSLNQQITSHSSDE